MGKWYETAAEKVARLTEPDPDSKSGCWRLVEGAHKHKGYGCAWIDGRHQALHRLTYEIRVGPIPDGMDLGHKCHDEAVAAGLCSDDIQCVHRECCNPEHLKPESRGENLGSSGHTQASKNKAKTHCKRHHEFTPENTRLRPNGWRSCIACDKMTPEERRAFDANMQVNGIDPDVSGMA